MTPFTVEWLPDAEQELADIWRLAPDRRAVSDAANVIDRILARNPLGTGEALSEGLRKITISLLTAYYSVDEASHLVSISIVTRSA